jgi:hypothetical protein
MMLAQSFPQQLKGEGVNASQTARDTRRCEPGHVV